MKAAKKSPASLAGRPLGEGEEMRLLWWKIAGLTKKPTAEEVEAIASASREACGRLTALAAAGEDAAIASVVSLASQLCSEARNLAGFHPQTVDAIARKRNSWPLNVDTHPEMQDRALRFLKALPLGESSGWRPTKRKPYSLRTPANLTMSLAIQSLAMEKGAHWESPDVAALPAKISMEWFTCAWKRLCLRGDVAKDKRLRQLGKDRADAHVKKRRVEAGTASYEQAIRDGIRDRLKTAFRQLFTPKE